MFQYITYFSEGPWGLQEDVDHVYGYEPHRRQCHHDTNNVGPGWEAVFQVGHGLELHHVEQKDALNGKQKGEQYGGENNTISYTTISRSKHQGKFVKNLNI
ncbi:hypothetical protein DPMN_004169 [Dreissena polymorpha]|uniref:Uncharacterized protein n=1 Tax=Dreissena polymorpha TaxID=45954 RepID=A0A9D4RTC0_DREPO|nr:hypothetical protein DPMN_004169 [Dreissena polymorpha]